MGQAIMGGVNKIWFSAVESSNMCADGRREPNPTISTIYDDKRSMNC